MICPYCKRDVQQTKDWPRWTLECVCGGMALNTVSQHSFEPPYWINPRRNFRPPPPLPPPPPTEPFVCPKCSREDEAVELRREGVVRILEFYCPHCGWRSDSIRKSDEMCLYPSGGMPGNDRFGNAVFEEIDKGIE